jgi:hypothetical protein
MPPTDQELFDAKLDAVNARNDSKIGLLLSEVDHLQRYSAESRTLILGSFAGGILALAALIVAMATYGDALFGRGMSVHDVVRDITRDVGANELRRTTLEETKDQLSQAREILEEIKKRQNPPAPGTK